MPKKRKRLTRQKKAEIMEAVQRGETPDGVTVMPDGRVILPTGQSVYPQSGNTIPEEHLI